MVALARAAAQAGGPPKVVGVVVVVVVGVGVVVVVGGGVGVVVVGSVVGLSNGKLATQEISGSC